MSPFAFPAFAPGTEAARLAASVAQFLAAPELVDRTRAGWLVACSGGADSCALLLLAAHAAGVGGAPGAKGARLEVACVDHGLRENAAGDVAFVADLCARLEVPFHTAKLALPVNAGENELRDARYRLFEGWMRERGLGAVLLGHTLEDQAETLLLHLIRGTGPRGLSGMRPVDGERVRPLLSWKKSQLQSFLRACGVTWREDETNAGDQYLRNRVRHGILGAMAGENPRVVEALAQTAELVRLEHDAIVELAEGELATRTVRLPGALESWPLANLLRWPPGIQMVLLRRWWRLLCAERGELRASAVQEVQQSLAASGTGAWDWPGPVRLVADRGLLVLSRPDAAGRLLETVTVTWDGAGSDLPPGSHLGCPQMGAGSWDGAGSDLPPGSHLGCPQMGAGSSANSSLRLVRPGDRFLRPDGTLVRCKNLLEDLPRGLRPLALALVDGEDRVVWLQYARAPEPPPAWPAPRVRLFLGDFEIPVEV